MASATHGLSIPSFRLSFGTSLSWSKLPRTSRGLSVKPGLVRRLATRPDGRREHRFNWNPDVFDASPDPGHSSYPRLTARDLASRDEPPRVVKLVARDFIDDSLYHPKYGYFSNQAVIFDPDQGLLVAREADVMESAEGKGKGFDFMAMTNDVEFDAEFRRRQGEYENRLELLGKSPARQVWHTPTELFKPWYGRAVARYLVSEYKSSLSAHEFIIYETGAGNGTLMCDILDYIAEREPEIYEKTKYRIIEISGRLADLQGKAVGKRPGGVGQKTHAAKSGHANKVEIIKRSIFEWEEVVEEPCFFLAFEVLDNFAHDVVRYTTRHHTPLQCFVSIDSTGDFTELYEPISDPLITRFLHLRSQLPTFARPRALHLLLSASSALRGVFSSLPFAPNLTKPEFLPTKALRLLEILRDKFPAHRLLVSDFAKLPDAMPGYNAPVVQTRYEGETVACSTYLVQQGFFDIFFPTDFHLLRDLYALVMSSSSSSDRPSEPTSTVASRARPLQLLAHRQFLERYGEIDKTTCRDGSNPMLEFYENAMFMC